MFLKSVSNSMAKRIFNHSKPQTKPRIKLNNLVHFRPICTKMEQHLKEQTPTHFKCYVLANNPDLVKEIILAGYNRDFLEVMNEAQVAFYIENRLTDEEFEDMKQKFDIESIRQKSGLKTVI